MLGCACNYEVYYTCWAVPVTVRYTIYTCWAVPVTVRYTVHVYMYVGSEPWANFCTDSHE